MVDAAKLEEILNGLDPDEDSAWTSTGLPRVEAVVAALTAEDPLFDEDLKRADIEAAHPDFNRHTVITADEDDDTEDDPAADPEDDPLADDEADEEASSDAETDVEADIAEALKPAVDEVLTEEAINKEALREQYTQELKALGLQRGEVLAARDDANRALDLIDAQTAELQKKFDGEVGPIPLSTALRDFINSSARERMRRSDQVIAINEAAGKVTGMTGMAPIDASRRQNRNRGAQRRIRGALRNQG